MGGCTRVDVSDYSYSIAMKHKRTFSLRFQKGNTGAQVHCLSYLVDPNHVSGHRQHSHEHDRITAAHNERGRVHAVTTRNSLNIEPSTCAKNNNAGYTKGPLKTNNREMEITS